MCVNSDDCMPYLAALLPTLQRLSRLDIGSNNITALAPLLAVAQRLVALCLNGNGHLTVRGLATMQPGHGALRSLNLSNLPRFGHDERLLSALALHLDHLDISKSRIGDAGVLCLAQALRCPESRLRVLNVSLNQIGPTGVETLMSAVAINARLTVLNVGGNEGHGCGVHIGRMLASNCHLEVLSSKGSRFTPDDVRAIARGLGVNRALLELNIYGNHAYVAVDGT